MKPKLHIANTFFEWELETEPNIPLPEAFYQSPIHLQLQFLPLLYADAMVVTDKPTADAKMFTFDDKTFPKDAEIESWGASRLIAKWAKQRGLTYHMPDWQIVKQINSKQFSFENSPKLPGSALLTNETQTKEWLQHCPGKKVLKTCFGLSGKGHLFVDKGSERISSFLQKEWNKGLPVIAEPWMPRILDFSTQWQIGPQSQVHYLGATLCRNDERGQYRSNTVGEEKTLFGPHLPFLAQHRKIAEPLLQKIANLGFFGNIGIDAMLYNPENPQLHPIVEINARKTMGWAALAFQKRHYPDKTISFCFAPGKEGYLPHQLTLKTGKTIHFLRNLSVQLNPVRDKT
jgi:hypothetical protein